MGPRKEGRIYPENSNRASQAKDRGAQRTGIRDPPWGQSNAPQKQSRPPGGSPGLDAKQPHLCVSAILKQAPWHHGSTQTAIQERRDLRWALDGCQKHINRSLDIPETPANHIHAGLFAYL